MNVVDPVNWERAWMMTGRRGRLGEGGREWRMRKQ